MPYALRAFGGPAFYIDSSANPASVPQSALAGSYYGGSSSTLPLVIPASLPPSSWYSVNGLLLDTQPTICTAPAIRANVVPAGSIFILLFATFTADTQIHLADKSTVSMRFPVYGGSVASGMVQLASTTANGVFQVVCTVVSDSPIVSQ